MADKRASNGSGNGSAKRAKTDGDISLRFLVPNSKAGSLIGKGGAAINSTRQASGANCRVGDNDSGSSDRVVCASGTHDQVQLAYKDMMLKLLTAAQENATRNGEESSGITCPLMNSEGLMQLKMVVPNNQVGGLIGKAGAVVKSMREQSGCFIKIANQAESAPGSSDRVVTLKGTQASVQTAQELITAMLTTIAPNTKSGGGGGGGGRMNMRAPQMQMQQQTPQYGAAAGGIGYAQHVYAQPGMQPGYAAQQAQQAMYGGQAGMAQQQAGYGAAYGQPTPQNRFAGQQSVGASGPSATVTMSVPNDMAGRLIGRGGSSINEMRQVSGAKIDIAKSESGAEQRTVTIIGTAEQNQVAQYLISMKLMAFGAQ